VLLEFLQALFSQHSVPSALTRHLSSYFLGEWTSLGYHPCLSGPSVVNQGLGQ
jgi:hypothetical protein